MTSEEVEDQLHEQVQRIGLAHDVLLNALEAIARDPDTSAYARAVAEGALMSTTVAAVQRPANPVPKAKVCTICGRTLSILDDVMVWIGDKLRCGPCHDGRPRPAKAVPLTGEQLAAKHGFRPHADTGASQVRVGQAIDVATVPRPANPVPGLMCKTCKTAFAKRTFDGHCSESCRLDSPSDNAEPVRDPVFGHPIDPEPVQDPRGLQPILAARRWLRDHAVEQPSGDVLVPTTPNVEARLAVLLCEVFEMGERAQRSETALPDELEPLRQRIAKGRAKYPNGCTVLSLLDEAGEVAHAVNKYEPAERVRDELLDVAGVAMRLYLGEIDRGLTIDDLVQVRIDEVK